MSRSRSRAAALALVIALSPLLAACGSGVDAATSQQRPSGNGANANVGPIQLRDITIVTGADGKPTGTILGTLVNTGTADDSLLGATIVTPTGATAKLVGQKVQGGQLPLPAQSATRVGFNSDDHLDITALTIPPTAYAQVEFSFGTAGRVTVPTMAVLPTGIYAGIAPLSTTS